MDADAIAHEILDQADISQKLIDRWGTGVLDSNGVVSRDKLAGHVFGSEEALKFLNALVHPRVLERVEVSGIVLDIPLLMEVGWEKRCDFLIFVNCSEEKRRERIAKNAKIDIEQFKKRENFQISLDKKKEKAHYEVSNNSDKSDMAEQIAQIFSSITGSSE
ncbi:MAG: dephospho-CoA kinase [Planctomycetota bacterium]